MNGFWTGYIAGLFTLPAAAMLVFLVIAFGPEPSYGRTCICCGEKPITGERDKHPVPGPVAWMRITAHNLTRAHRVNHRAWVKAGKPCIDWKPVA